MMGQTISKQSKFSGMVAQLILFGHALGLEVTLGEAWRPQEMQKIYFEKGLSKTLINVHESRMAIDLNIFHKGVWLTKGEDYRKMGEFWEMLGGTWGGRFDVKKENYDKEVGWDPGHFQNG